MGTSLKIDNFRNEFSFLSNFYLFHFLYNDKYYICSEVAYQCSKFNDINFEKTNLKLFSDKKYGDVFLAVEKNNKKIHQFLRALKTPAMVKKAAKILSDDGLVIDNFHEKKLEIMYDIVFNKFTGNAYLRERLLKTGDTELIEKNYWNDTFWGVCNNVGENNLGKILMRVRHEIKELRKFESLNITRIL